MVYSQKLVACIKVNGQILREDRDTVTIPFGAEYSLYLKNLNSVRVQVKVSIDGQDATEGTWLVIHPNSYIELERFIKSGNLSRGNRFKFIERTGKIEKHRGIGGEDGLIRIEYKTEKVLPKPIPVPVVYYDYYAWPNWWPYTYRPTWWGTPYIYQGVQYVCNNTPNVQNSSLTGLNSLQPTYTSSSGNVNSNGTPFIGNLQSHSGLRPSTRSGQRLKSSAGARLMRSMTKSSASMDYPPDSIDQSLNDAGITVAGSESSQQFHWTSSFPVHETSDVIVLKLRGSVGGEKVVKAVTVKTKPICKTCGKKNRPTVKFCAECGTALTIL